jgi:hypothetical protein
MLDSASCSNVHPGFSSFRIRQRREYLNSTLECECDCDCCYDYCCLSLPSQHGVRWSQRTEYREHQRTQHAPISKLTSSKRRDDNDPQHCTQKSQRRISLHVVSVVAPGRIGPASKSIGQDSLPPPPPPAPRTRLDPDRTWSRRSYFHLHPVRVSGERRKMGRDWRQGGMWTINIVYSIFV